MGFHGSAFGNTLSILRYGLDKNKAKAGGIFGDGVYLSSCPEVAANFIQYAPVSRCLGAASGVDEGDMVGCLFVYDVAKVPGKVRWNLDGTRPEIAQHYVLAQGNEFICVRNPRSCSTQACQEGATYLPL